MESITITKDDLNQMLDAFAERTVRPMIRQELLPLEVQLDKLESRVDGIDRKLDDMDLKIDTIMIAVGERHEETTAKLNSHNLRIHNLERGFGRFA